LCVDKAVEIGNRILRDPAFHPEKQYNIDSTIVVGPASGPAVVGRASGPARPLLEQPSKPAQ
jgi:hypothetical protein